MNEVNYINSTLVTNPCYIALCTTEKQFHKELTRLQLPLKDHPEYMPGNADACAHELVSSKGDNIILVCLGDVSGHSLPEIYALIVHEAIHAWQFVREDIGEKSPSSEFEAYAVQHICLGLFSAYYRSNRKRKVKK
jgi:hypothetical protein